MKHLNNEQLNMRIDTFLTRKHQEYPELSLRGTEKHADSIGYAVTDTLLDFITSGRFAKFVN